MKKSIKIIFIIFAILVIFIIIDTIQAKIFDNNPLIKIRDNCDGGNVDYIDKGIFVDTYVFTYGEKVTVYKWEKYSPPEEKEPVDLVVTSKEENENNLKYKNLEDVEIDYDLSQMVEDKCYIVLNTSKIYNREDLNGFIVYNLDELDNFTKNVENNKSDEIRIVEYTPDEQQPILIDLQYKNNKFIMKIDNRRDATVPKEDRKIVINEYDSSEYTLVKNEVSGNTSNIKANYELNLQSKNSNKTIHVCDYVEKDEENNQKFEIQFNKDVNSNKITKILGKEEKNKYDYDIYSYKGTVDIVINNEKMSLRDALINNKITIDEILEKANRNQNELKIFGDFYQDGGSRYYLYEDYSIIKLNTLKGKSDLYIGVPSMNINDIK